jgi:diaminohydroxyphosphoribosylaminopyrimidine deaminase/5-amino-6-(5-phosphoribosylamino)uracil reductase
VTGIGTVQADDPALTVRIPGRRRPPLRVVLDSRLRLSPDARLLAEEGPVLVVAADANDAVSRLPPATELLRLPATQDGIDLERLCRELAYREINEVMVEAGATLSGAWLRSGLVDELVIYMAPKLLGDGARGLFHLPGLTTMAEAVSLEIRDIRAIGQDWRITANVTDNEGVKSL